MFKIIFLKSLPYGAMCSNVNHLLYHHQLTNQNIKINIIHP